MKRTGFFIALALLLAAHTAAKADSRTAHFCGPDHVNEVASDDVRSNPGGYYVASLKSMDDRAMFTAIVVTIHLTNRGKLIRLPHVKPMTSMAECRAWTHQQEFMRVLSGYLATFHYCDCALEP
ncbi:hypothetical protein SAMN04488498_1112 [Mesorhizobium albiziae]|uniref:Rap1a immunity protein domain-containing protein n=1 Tax=Neomesorhizobium albiziae TaxID=335020 RepID=A0A1I4BRJ3_9HYPH|nr:hypothetical protein [Mesorhizobium albiziae]GLS29728.1 hypothetical protein GCM10007937_14360 [Mesorhizobium albiziae]SFK70817.1 hypothetical protein SAMN04488498_1112 [Mesorhizobium albiziae]